MTESLNTIAIHFRKLNTPLRVTVVAVFFSTLFYFISQIMNVQAVSSDVILRDDPVSARERLFDVQCIDTMKISRDKAREMEKSANRETLIRSQVTEIASLGANCIAIGTPYNDEFLPVLKAWVDEARKNKLHVWFRGNFAEWEGWFGYSKSMSTSDHLEQTRQFIISHPDLFRDGDIFTPAPEAENGGPFAPVNSNAKTINFRAFLVDEKHVSDIAFKTIGIKVTTNWLSMSGGVATSILDEKTINQIGNVVTLDHYVASTSEMKSYIDHFATTPNTGIVLGEFGAPIPNINGLMTDDEQSIFVSNLLNTLYKEKGLIKGVNYWTLSDSSTALLTPSGKEKKVAGALKSYYLPGILTGKITNTIGEPVKNVRLRTDDFVQSVKSDKNGAFTIKVPAGKATFAIDESEEYLGKKIKAEFSPGQKIHADITIRPQKVLLFYRFKDLLRQLTK